MENPSQPTSANARPMPPALGYSGAALALWVFRRPILALVSIAIQLTFALVKPALLILGALKVADFLQASRESTREARSGQLTPASDEALLIPSRPVEPTSHASPAGLEA